MNSGARIKLPLSLGKLLREDTGELRNLLAHAQCVARAASALRDCLAAPLVDHCQVANIKGDTVILQADSSAWAAKLRFQVADIVRGLKRTPEFRGLRTVRVKIRPVNDIAAPGKIFDKERGLSKYAQSCLLDAARDSGEPALKAVLERMARR